jgi:hydrogenase expression/formation protein HypD
MKFIDEYRDKNLIMKLADHIRNSVRNDLVFMEVCGGHTSAIHRFGIPYLLPGNIKLISGPGCPVCVTGNDFIDKAVKASLMDDVILTTFGDLIRVPGSNSTLDKERAKGADIRIVISGLDALEIARINPDKRVIFLGIGFETTAPGTAVTMKKAKEENRENFYLLSAHKIMPPAMEAIIKDGININGFICPGHVAAITGSEIFCFIPEKYKLGCVVAGFEPVDIVQAILMLVNQVNSNSPGTEIQYSRAVSKEGNSMAKKHLTDVFEVCDASWRGFGVIPGSGLMLKKEFERFDAEKFFPSESGWQEEKGSCICGDILRGKKNPPDCPLFGKACVPDNPTGACMVSNEGACNTWFKYRINE